MKRFLLVYVIFCGIIAVLSFIWGEQSVELEYYAGMFCGMLTAGVIIAFFSRVIRKLGGKFRVGCDDNSFDERQLLARGQAYKMAFFTLLGYVAVAGILDEVADVSVLMSLGGMWIGVCLAIVVFASICIWKDAYMSLYENARGLIMMFSFVAVLNLLVLIPVFLKRELLLVEDNTLAVSSLNLMVGITFLIIDVMFIAKVIYNKNHVEEDEE